MPSAHPRSGPASGVRDRTGRRRHREGRPGSAGRGRRVRTRARVRFPTLDGRRPSGARCADPVGAAAPQPAPGAPDRAGRRAQAGARRPSAAVGRAASRGWEAGSGSGDRPMGAPAQGRPRPAATGPFLPVPAGGDRLPDAGRPVERRPRGPAPQLPLLRYGTRRDPRSVAEWMLRLHRTSAEPTDFVAALGEREVRPSRQTVKNFGRAVVKAVTAGPPRVHVHLPMHLHMNRAMIRVS